MSKPSVFDLDMSELVQLARWRPGETVTARKLNAPVDRLNLLAEGVRVPKQMAANRPSDAAVAVAPSATTLRLRVKSAAYNDYLYCKEWDGADEGDTVYVAKPYTLRASVTSRAGVTYAYDGTKVQRTATKGADSETQLIVPSYYLNDQIWAVRADTGVTRSGDDLVWLDMNADGREFKRKVT